MVSYLLYLSRRRYEQVTGTNPDGVSKKGPRTIHVGGLEAISEVDNIEDEARIATVFEQFGKVAATSLRYRRENGAEGFKVSWALVSFATSTSAQSVINSQESEMLRGISKQPLTIRPLDLEIARTSHGSMREIAKAHSIKLRQYDQSVDGSKSVHADHSALQKHVQDVGDECAQQQSREDRNGTGGFTNARDPNLAHSARTAELAKTVADIAQRVEANERAAAEHRARVEAALSILLQDHEESVVPTESVASTLKTISAETGDSK